MLAYILGLVVGTSSLLILVKTVLAKDLQKEANLFQTDIFWSGVGLFYGLALWVCAERITGALLLGQIASVCLIIWLVVQVKEMRLAADGISPPPNSNFITDLFRKPENATELTLTEVAEELEQTIEEPGILEAEIEFTTEETEDFQVETDKEKEEVYVNALKEDIYPETEVVEVIEEKSREEVTGAQITTTTEAITESSYLNSDEVTPEAENGIDSEINIDTDKVNEVLEPSIEELEHSIEESIEEDIDSEIEVFTPTTGSEVEQELEVEAKHNVKENKTKEADSEN